MATQSDFRVKKGLIVGTTDTANPESGTFTYDADFETVDLTLDANVNARLAQDHYFYVKAGATITKGDVVYASGAVGNSGKIEATPYIANNTIDESLVLGVAAEDIATGAFGYVSQFGSIRGLDASGGLTTGGESWTDGSILYASPTYAGELTLTKPSAPNQDIPIAFVISNNGSNGVIAVRASRLGYHMDEVHDVEITSIADKDLLVYNSSNSRWENGKTLGDLTLTGELNGPATFYIDPAPHDPDTDGATNGLVVIRGDLQVDGTTTTINSTTVDIDDLNITLASGAANAAAADGAGITIDGASATLTYDSTDDEFDFNKGITASKYSVADGTVVVDGAKRGYFVTLSNDNPVSFLDGTDGTSGSGAQGINVRHVYAGVSYASATAGAGDIEASANFKMAGNIVINGDRDYIGEKGSFINDDSADNNIVTIGNDYAAADTAGDSAGLLFQLYRSYASGLNDAAYIKAVKEDAWTASNLRNASLQFGTRDSTNVPSTKMTLRSNGQLYLYNTESIFIDDATEYSATEASELSSVGTDALYLFNEENTSTNGKVSILMRSTGSGGGAAGRITLKNNRSGNSAFAFFMRDNNHTSEQKEKLYLDSDANLSLSGTAAVTITATPGTTPGNNSSVSLGRADGSSNVQMNTALTVDVAISGIAGVSVGSTNSNTPATRLRSANSASGHIVIAPKGTEKIRITAAEGHMLPADTNQDLGSASQPWQNIYTQDLNLSNEKRDEGNSVDGTKGNWTIQEGDEHLYIINNKSGKRFRFALEEIE